MPILRRYHQVIFRRPDETEPAVEIRFVRSWNADSALRGVPKGCEVLGVKKVWLPIRLPHERDS